MDCSNLEKNRSICNCTYTPCSRKGICCECILYHKRLGELPACYFDSATEKTFDRSIEAFIRMYQKKRGLEIEERV